MYVNHWNQGEIAVSLATDCSSGFRQSSLHVMHLRLVLALPIDSTIP